MIIRFSPHVPVTANNGDMKTEHPSDSERRQRKAGDQRNKCVAI